MKPMASIVAALIAAVALPIAHAQSFLDCQNDPITCEIYTKVETNRHANTLKIALDYVDDKARLTQEDEAMLANALQRCGQEKQCVLDAYSRQADWLGAIDPTDYQMDAAPEQEPVDRAHDIEEDESTTTNGELGESEPADDSTDATSQPEAAIAASPPIAPNASVQASPPASEATGRATELKPVASRPAMLDGLAPPARYALILALAGMALVAAFFVARKALSGIYMGLSKYVAAVLSWLARLFGR